MERLIKDANKLRKAQGLAGDLTIEKYSDVIEAIHLVQTEMGITGTTALEAKTTITGSLNATKAAWKNLLISFATGNKRDIKQAMDGMVASARNVVTNVVPVISTALTSISGFIGEIAPIVATELPGIITEAGPAFLSAAGSLIGSFVSNVPAMLSGLGGAIVKAITGNENASWSEVGKAIHDGIASVFTGGVNDLKEMLGIQDGASWNEIGLAISNGAKSAFSEGVNFVKSLLGIEEGTSWNEIGSAISNGAKTAVTEGVNFVKGLLGIEPGMSWAEIGSAIVDGATSAITNGANFIKGLLGIEESASWPEVGRAIVNGIKSVFDGGESGADVGKSIVSFITNAIESVGGIAAAIGKALAGAITGGGAELGLAAFKSGLLAKLLDAIADITSSLIKAGDDIIGAIAEGIAEGIPGLQGKVDEIKGVIEGIIGFVTVIKIIGYANMIADGLKAAFSGIATAALGVNPVVLGIAALVGILIYFWNTSEDFRNVVGAIWNGIVEGVGKAVEDLKSRFEQLKEAVETTIAFLKDPMGEWDRRNKKLKLQAEAEVEVKPEFVFAHPEALSEEDKQALMDEFVQQFDGGTLKIGLDTTIAEESAAGAAAAGESVAAEIGLAGETGAGELESALALAGVSAGGAINGSLVDNITSAAQTAAQALQEALSAAGSAAAAGIQAALRGLQLPSLSIGVQTTQQTPGVGRKKHASAMTHGEILQGLTPFGVDSRGTVHYGGEAGPEAVVGVNSLDGMIQRSVQKAIAGVLSKMDELRAGQNQSGMQVVLDSGALVGAIAPAMDERLYDIAAWRGGGRA